MAESEKLTETPPGVRLCPVEEISDPGARNFVLEIGGRYFHGFVVHRDGRMAGYLDRCPHMGLPLARTLDDYLTPGGDLIACGWHGALFAIDNGHCVGGPCAGSHLHSWPVAIRDGFIVTA
ncbi:Rieske (2Fe-2S) protein [Asticcacaulis sp.]|uniref:Rieske (2Fe-2S) protein n=1 Tax=Asticcacaulis sp. TaxID=1872648 RepID=UPI002CC6F7A2|nr:Rieske (2Fe-2S) protein [Asticcacaulis sp.]HTM81588.1 Rieske (2Fe-2S) protein [Asticcacaulis sp.]